MREMLTVLLFVAAALLAWVIFVELINAFG